LTAPLIGTNFRTNKQYFADIERGASATDLR
jgi:hypothetical protein